MATPTWEANLEQEKLTYEEKKYVRQLFKINLGADLSSDEDFEESFHGGNHSFTERTFNPAGEVLQLNPVKKEIIEEVFFKFVLQKNGNNDFNSQSTLENIKSRDHFSSTKDIQNHSNLKVKILTKPTDAKINEVFSDEPDWRLRNSIEPISTSIEDDLSTNVKSDEWLKRVFEDITSTNRSAKYSKLILSKSEPERSSYSVIPVTNGKRWRRIKRNKQRGSPAKSTERSLGAIAEKCNKLGSSDEYDAINKCNTNLSKCIPKESELYKYQIENIERITIKRIETKTYQTMTERKYFCLATSDAHIRGLKTNESDVKREDKVTSYPQSLVESSKEKSMGKYSERKVCNWYKPMEDENGKFYIEPQTVKKYQDLLREKQWNPTQCVYELCNRCDWLSPKYSVVHFIAGIGFLCGVVVKDQLFVSSRLGKTKKPAKHCASTRFLHFLGFQVSYDESQSRTIFIKDLIGSRRFCTSSHRDSYEFGGSHLPGCSFSLKDHVTNDTPCDTDCGHPQTKRKQVSVEECETKHTQTDAFPMRCTLTINNRNKRHRPSSSSELEFRPCCKSQKLSNKAGSYS